MFTILRVSYGKSSRKSTKTLLIHRIYSDLSLYSPFWAKRLICAFDGKDEFSWEQGRKLEKYSKKL